MCRNANAGKENGISQEKLFLLTLGGDGESTRLKERRNE